MQVLSKQQIKETSPTDLDDLGIGDFPIYYIDSRSHLLALANRLKDVDWIAIDTEFIREKTYFPHLCLIQISTGEFAACIDPLKLRDFNLILDVIFNDNITKVMHAGRQDMEIFYHLRGSIPQNIFDTQLAAPYLGFAEQISYAAMVTEFTGLKINKSQTRTDWRARPLTNDQIKYAASDVYFLAKVYTTMHNNIKNRNRITWLEEEFSKLTSCENYAQNPDLMWQKIRGHDRLPEKNLRVLATLAAWRELTARKIDSPRNWLIRDDILLELARLLPTNHHALKKITNLGDKFRLKYGEMIIECIANANHQFPKLEAMQKCSSNLTADQNSILDVLMALVRRCAVDHKINSCVISSKKELEQFLLDNSSTKLMQGWRKKIIGEQLTAMLNGEIAIKIMANQLLLIDKNIN